MAYMLGLCREIWRRIEILQLKILRLYPYYNPLGKLLRNALPGGERAINTYDYCW